jgi:chromosome segregation ATPase
MVVKLAKYQTKVKCYQRKKSRQYLITLTGNHGFKNDEPVIILSEADFKELENISNSRKNQILDLEARLTELEGEKDHELFLKDHKIKNLEESLKTSQTQVKDLKAELKDLEEIRQGRENEISALNNQVTLYKTKVQNLENEVTEFKENTAESDARVKTLEQELSNTKVRIKELEFMEDQASKFKELQNDYNRLRNKHDHLQERLRTALEEINNHQKVISDLSNRGFIDFIIGRLPESYKQLNEPKKDDNR